MTKQKLKFLVLSVLLLALPAVTQAQVLVEDGFAGAAGALPDAAKFEWSGNVTLNGVGQLSVQTLPSGFSWIRSKAGAAPGLGQTLVLQMRASAYAEGGSPGIVYGDKQPRGLRVGTNLNNSVEFYSAARTSVGMRVRKDGVESSATYALPAGVDSMHDYQISVTTTSAVFTVDGALAGTFTTNIPTGVLNVHVCAYYSGGGNVAVTPDSVSLSLTNSQVQGPPAISSFAPANGPVGSSVAISGTNFTGITAVRFGGVDAAFTNNSALLITAIVPPTAATGLISVVSTNGTAASSNNFLVQPLDFTWTTNAGAITIASYTGPGGAVVIPDTINDLPVTSIGGYAFNGESSVTSVTIPNGVTNIGEKAFFYCTGLTSVTIPDGVISIGYSAFSYCSSLTGVTIPQSVTSIGDWAFDNCLNLTAITVDALNSAYSSVAGVLFNKSTNALIRCPGGKTGSFTIPSSVTNIENVAFSACYSLTGVTIPNSVTSIGMGVFYSCYSLTNISIPDSVTGSIGMGTFQYCTNLTSVTIGTNVTILDDSAFDNCTSLTSITIPNSVIGIGRNVFYNCYSLTSVSIGTNVTGIWDSAFSWCTSLTSVTVPDSVTTIWPRVFYHCSSLTSVMIGKSGTSIADNAFEECYNLTAITADALNPVYRSVAGVLFNQSLTTLIKYPYGIAGSYTIPNSVTNIGYQAFYSCGRLTSVTIPDSVINIGDWAFVSCTNLTSVTIGNRVTNIGYLAFASCYSLTGVYFSGNAPDLDAPDLGGGVVAYPFSGDNQATVYYLPGKTGWPTVPDAWGGRPTALWFLPNPLILNNGPSFGVRTNRFGFTITGTNGLIVVVEACTNLTQPAWFALQTNTLIGGWSYFSDSQWTNYPARFYRLRLPWGGSGQISIISVSSTSPTPLTPLALATAGIATNDPVSVRFFNTAGFSVSNTPIRVKTDGTVIVAVPLYVDPSTSMVTNGTVSLVLSQGSQVSAPVTINIQNLPLISTYGTQLGQITRSHLVFQEILLARQLNQLEAAQLLITNVDTSQARSTVTNLLQSAILARKDVESIMLDNSTVIASGFLADGTPILFDRNSLDMMDRVLAVHLTGLAGTIGLTSSLTAQARQSGTHITAASVSVPVLQDILEFLGHENGVVEFIAENQDGLKSEGFLDSVLSITQGATSFVGLGLSLVGSSASKVATRLGGILTMASVVKDVVEMSTDLGVMLTVSAYGNDPYLLQAAHEDIDNLQVKTFEDSASTLLAAAGFKMDLIKDASQAWILKGGIAAGIVQLGVTSYEFIKSGEAKNSYDTAVNLSHNITVFPSPNQGFGQITGTAPAQSSLDLCCLGASALGIKGIADPSGYYEMFVPLDVSGTDYSKLTLSAGDFITGSTWGSETVDLSGLNTSKPVQVPPIILPPSIIIFKGTATATATSSAPSSQFYNGGCLPDPVVGTSTFTPRTVELVLDANPLVLGPISGTLYLGSTTQTATIPEVTCINWFDGQALTYIFPSATYTGDLPAYSRPINGHSDGTNIVLDPDGSYDSETFTGTVSTAPVTGIVQFSGQDIVTFINNRQTNVIITTYSLTRQ